jgi:hypothetical protein
MSFLSASLLSLSLRTSSLTPTDLEHFRLTTLKSSLSSPSEPKAFRTGALPFKRLSWTCIVGGLGDADSSTFPLLDTAMTVGGCCGGSISAREIEYA